MWNCKQTTDPTAFLSTTNELCYSYYSFTHIIMGVLGKPVRPAPNVEKEVESRSLSSINAELVSHGFAKRPLKLDALSSADQAQLASVLCEILQSNSVSSPNVFV